MKSTGSRFAIMALAAVSLSGCSTIHSIFASAESRGQKASRLHGVEMDPGIARAVDEGRSHLAKGETGLAIECFQRALSGGTPIAAALNGLGVSYARLGRYEVAQQYFLDAMTVDPLDGRFAANLAQLHRSPAFAMRHDADLAAAALADARTEGAPSSSIAASTSPEPGRLTRVSANEFRITTLAPLNEPIARTVSARAMAKRPVALPITAASGSKPAARLELGKPAASGSEAATMRTVSNPHTGKTAAVDSQFKALVKFTFARSGNGYQVLKSR